MHYVSVFMQLFNLKVCSQWELVAPLFTIFKVDILIILFKAMFSHILNPFP